MIPLLILYTIYWIEHFYLFLKINSAFAIGTGTNILLGTFLFLLTLTPLFIHIYSLRGQEKLSRLLAYPSYLWMAFIILFFPMAIFLDLYNLILRISEFVFQKDLKEAIFSPIYTLSIPSFLAIVFSAYGYFEAKDLRVERFTLHTPKLPEGTDRLTIVHISDLHLGLLVREKILNKVIKIIETVKPDLIVSTGDLVDGEINHIDYLADKLKKVRARLGKFASMGNHEFIAGDKLSIKFIEKAGFTLLRDSGVTIQNLINIVGIDDILGEKKKSSKKDVIESEGEILSKLPSDKFTLLLKHRPDIDKDSLGSFDLQLSGHTHKGQIFPINLVTRLLFHTHAGFTNLPEGSAIYVSRGAGTTCSPVRFLSPPEITVIEIASTKQQNIKIREQK